MHRNQFSFQDILNAYARISSHVVRTPLLNSPMLDEVAGCSLYVKAESLQRTGSFKYRGALNKILSLGGEEQPRGVVTYSAGNHGHAVSAAAKLVGRAATIVLPSTAAPNKVANCKWWGAETIFYDPIAERREDVANDLIDKRGLVFIPPFDDGFVMAGQGTAGLEACEQLKECGVVPDVVLVNTSGGGLASGFIEAVKHFYPSAECYVVEQAGYEKMAAALATGNPQRIAVAEKTILDGINGPETGAKPLSVLLRHGVKALGVTQEEALHAMAIAFASLKLVMEPAGAASLGAVLARKTPFAGCNVLVVASGGNVDADVFGRALDHGGGRDAA
ncbi:threonine ammonia-lyase [Sinorhizobium fredii]|uniref:threonine ammonia-lyase n=2 Tax=Rhizobium fredii TaxID=380 RepID=UPI00056C9B5C|nr:threonine/serine dehydratase [Sinorhizobium fredii]